MALLYVEDFLGGVAYLTKLCRNLTVEMPPRRVWPSITKVTSWATKYVSNSHTVADGRQSTPVILELVSNAEKPVTGLGMSFTGNITPFRVSSFHI